MRNVKIVIGLIFFLLKPWGINAQSTFKIIASETNEPISFALLTTDDLNIKYEADIEGIIKLEINKSVNYTFSRLGYKSLRINGGQLIENKIVRMEPLPVELNTIVISANTAWFDLNRAIDNTFKTLSKSPFYIKCDLNDKVKINDKVVVAGKATILSKVLKLKTKGKGCKSNSKLKKLLVELSNCNADSIKRLPYYKVPFINNFLIGENRKCDNNISFYYMDINDTLLIIGYSPRLKFEPKNYVLTSGRYLIDKKKWTLIRIDSELNQKMLDFQKSEALRNPKKELLFQKFTRSIFFSDRGLPTKLEEKFAYSLKNDKSKAIWENSTTHIYTEVSEKEFTMVPVKDIDDKSILLQKTYPIP